MKKSNGSLGPKINFITVDFIRVRVNRSKNILSNL